MTSVISTTACGHDADEVCHILRELVDGRPCAWIGDQNEHDVPSRERAVTIISDRGNKDDAYVTQS